MAPHEAFADRAWVRTRYVGQGHELDVPFDAGDDVVALAARFGALHRERFGHELERAVEFVSLRVVVEGAWWPLATARHAAEPGRAATPFDGVDHGGALDVTLDGPCTVRLPDATLRVAAGWRARSLEAGGWWLERTEAVA
jgi:N-methylhydantoinase A